MNAFYFAAAVLAAIALTMLLRPLRAKPQASRTNGHNALLETNNAIYRTQLAELKRDHEIGQLSDADYAQAFDELQRRLLDDAQATALPDAAQTTSTDHTRRTRIALAFFLPLSALGIYSQIGNPVAALSTAEQTQHAEQSMDKMIAKLRAKLDANPDNPEGWAMLAQSYGALGRWDDAAQAFTHIGPKLTQDPRLLAAFAEVLARQAHGKFEGKPRTLIALALKLDPRHPYALMLAGSDAFQDRRWSDVIANWEPLLAQLDPASEDAQSLEQGLAKAREMSGIKADKAPVGAGGTPSNGNTSVSGRVELAAGLKDKTLPDDTVFIFARAVGDDNAPASRMPLAVRRAQVKDLPLNFVLDDSMAMTPQSKISGAKQLRVEARISRSGNAIAAAGDIAGQSKTIKPGAAKLNISLDHVVP
ncbi:MAG: c-type cytochrome biogenesis protein CcmI [Rhodocyclaceae bacterium]|nr:c-type cytochrome biogenesis protein CcmI [Rhodocyclaceae bacterium]